MLFSLALCGAFFSLFTVSPVQAGPETPFLEDPTPEAPPDAAPAPALEEEALIFLSPPDLQKFPKIDTYLHVSPKIWENMRNLSEKDVILLEDDKPVEGMQMQAENPGVQLVVALNPDAGFSVRDAQARSRMDYLAQSFRDWAAAHADSSKASQEPDDDLSLISADGMEATHLPAYSDWLAKWNSYQLAPDAAPSFDLLVKSLDLALDAPPHPGMSKAVFFITAPPAWEDTTTFENQIVRAREQSVRVFVWVVAARGYAGSQGVNNLGNLAEKTGGKIFFYTGSEPLPNPDEALAPLRSVYRITYPSAVRASGSHNLVVQTNSASQMYASPKQEFSMEISYPQPIFVSPPREIVIVKQNPDSADENTGGQNPPAVSYKPDAYTFKIIVDFPDGYRRELTRTALYVDGQLVTENTQAPFDSFTWDLKQIGGSGEHLIQVEAIDEIGLSGVSLETPVKIQIEIPQATLASMLARQGKWIALAAIALSGFVLFWALVLGGKLHPRSFFLETRSRAVRYQYLDPVTQPVAIRTEPVTRPRMMKVEIGGAPQNDPWGQSQPINHSRAPVITQADPISRPPLPWQDLRPSTPLAYLVRLAEAPIPGTNPEDSKPFAILSREMTIGSHPKAVDLTIQDPSVEKTHARLARREDGSFWVTDLGSTAGTWVNYAPIAPDGARLTSGDLLHIGRVGFRFTLYVEPKSQPRRAVISPAEEGLSKRNL